MIGRLKNVADKSRAVEEVINIVFGKAMKEYAEILNDISQETRFECMERAVSCLLDNILPHENKILLILKIAPNFSNHPAMLPVKKHFKNLNFEMAKKAYPNLDDKKLNQNIQISFEAMIGNVMSYIQAEEKMITKDDLKDGLSILFISFSEKLNAASHQQNEAA